MTNIKHTKERNWTLIGCCALAVCLTTYALISIKISSVTEKYRIDVIANYAEINANLQKTECDMPIAAYMSHAKRNGFLPSNKKEIELVDTATRERCSNAEKTISENKEKMKKAIYLKPSFSHITQHILG